MQTNDKKHTKIAKLTDAAAFIVIVLAVYYVSFGHHQARIDITAPARLKKESPVGNFKSGLSDSEAHHGKTASLRHESQVSQAGEKPSFWRFSSFLASNDDLVAEDSHQKKPIPFRNSGENSKDGIVTKIKLE